MSKNTSPRRVVVADYKAKKGDEGAIVLVDDKGAEYRIAPREIWSDDLLTAVQDANENDPIAVGRALLGDDEYAKFVAGGGSATILSSVVGEEWEDQIPNS